MKNSDRKAIKKEIAPAALSSEEAALYLGLSKCDLDQSRISGSLSGLTPPRFIRIGRRVRYRMSDLEQWLNSHDNFTTLAEESSS